VVTTGTACAFVALCAAALVACSRGDDAARTSATRPGPHRIVALTCAAVDVITVLGELDRVVAVEEDCPAPGTEGKVKIRNDDHPGKQQAINVESILALRPDLVIAQPNLKPALDGRGLTILWTPSVVTMGNMAPYVADIGRALGADERARQAIEAMDAKLAAIGALTAGARPVRVYYETTGLGWTVGKGPVMDDMIRLAGGTNIAGDIEKPTVTLNGEAILETDPEVIVLGPFADKLEDVVARPGWDRLSAVRNGRVHRIPVERRYVMLGTPRCVEGCEQMLLPWLHPELVPKGR
jgi:iron complex transport system substrate-binding protein